MPTTLATLHPSLGSVWSAPGTTVLRVIVLAAVVIAVVGVAFVLWLRRLVAEGKASGQWNADDDA